VLLRPRDHSGPTVACDPWHVRHHADDRARLLAGYDPPADGLSVKQRVRRGFADDGAVEGAAVRQQHTLPQGYSVHLEITGRDRQRRNVYGGGARWGPFGDDGAQHHRVVREANADRRGAGARARPRIRSELGREGGEAVPLYEAGSDRRATVTALVSIPSLTAATVRPTLRSSKPAHVRRTSESETCATRKNSTAAAARAAAMPDGHAARAQGVCPHHSRGPHRWNDARAERREEGGAERGGEHGGVNPHLSPRGS
jgi:hypothetical protein